METTAVRLVRVDSGGIHKLLKPHALVDYKPDKKFQVEKQNAFDPTYYHRRGPYREDRIDVAFIITAEEYPELLEFVTLPGALYIEFTWAGPVILQLPCVCDSLPEMRDDGREYRDEFRARFTARYRSWTPIDWDTGAIEIPDGGEEQVP